MWFSVSKGHLSPNVKKRTFRMTRGDERGSHSRQSLTLQLAQERRQRRRLPSPLEEAAAQEQRLKIWLGSMSETRCSSGTPERKIETLLCKPRTRLEELNINIDCRECASHLCWRPRGETEEERLLVFLPEIDRSAAHRLENIWWGKYARQIESHVIIWRGHFQSKTLYERKNKTSNRFQC